MNTMTRLPYAKWRVILSQPARGSWNMAVDEALLENTYRGETLPTLRLYAWSPPCLSLGYAQPFSDVNFSATEKLSWDVVRRPTGGRAILHRDELTYAVVGPASEPLLTGGVLESYRRISKALLQALNQLGVPAKVSEKSSHQTNQTTQNPVCFDIPSNYEITVEGKKLIGSAQARRREGILQHGSLPLYGDITQIIKVLSFSDNGNQLKASHRLSDRAITLEATLGYKITWEEVAQEIIDTFQEVLNIKFEPGDLSRAELDRATKLEKDKYLSPEWSRRVK